MKPITLVISLIVVLFMAALFTFGAVMGLRTSLQIATAPSLLPTAAASPTAAPFSSPKPSPTGAAEAATSTPLPTAITTFINHDVPFTSQAPFGQWSDPVFQDGCEESSILMAMHWVNGTPITGPQAATQAISDISNFEQQTYGEFRDRSAADTAQLVKDYFKYNNVELRRDITIEDVKQELARGNVIVIPADGQALSNPYFTAPGPERHMLLVRGYDPMAKQFITNDPGTQYGEDYRYGEQALFNAIRDYPTGYHEPIIGIEKVMIVFRPRSA